ncbi:MAG: YaaA family protein [Bacillota bacterium]
MKIILSPSKRQNKDLKLNYPIKQLIFPNKTNELYEIINKKDKNELGKLLNISNNLLDKSYNFYKDFNSSSKKHCITTYNGLVFKNINIKDYSKNELKYLEKNLRILSAMYGILTPMTGIYKYRLDMKAKFENLNLYNFWEKEIQNYFESEDCIINLASNEFSKLVKSEKLNDSIVNILFKETKDNKKFRTVAARAKKVRGMMVDFMVKNKIDSIENIKEFEGINYSFNDDMSSENELYFTRYNK